MPLRVCLPFRHTASQMASRGFASTTPCLASPSAIANSNSSSTLPGRNQIIIKSRIYDIVPPPPYPYGANRWYKQSNHGLYGGARVRSGNNVSKITETTTRRKWNPNVINKNVFSAALNRKIRLRMTTRVLRTIDKVGGLDEYLIGEKEARIRELGMEGWKLRWAVMMSNWGRAKLGAQAKALGLPDEVRAERGWMKKHEFEDYMLKAVKAESGAVEQSAEEVDLARKFEAGELTPTEEKQYTEEKVAKDKAERAALWESPEMHKLWDEFRGTRVIVAKTKSPKGKEIQRVLVLREAVSEPTVPEESALEEVQEWTEEDDARVGYDADALASLGEEAHEEAARLAR